MLKRLAILGLLVLVSGAWSQIPRNGSSQHDKAQDKQETANPAKPVVVVDSQHGANNQEHATEKPAKYPWKELLAPANIPNWFLVVVGGITGWFVYKTLKAINRQADLMKEQSDLAKSKERARLRVEMGDVVLEPTPNFFLGLGTNWKVKIYGTSEAFIIGSECLCWIGDKDNYQLPRPLDPTGIPDVISPQGKPLLLFANLWNTDGSEYARPAEAVSVLSGKKVLYCTGIIIFENVYDETWMLEFARYYEVTGAEDDETFGLWSRNNKEKQGESQLFPEKIPKRNWFERIFRQP
jgi:hypothetical protein